MSTPPQNPNGPKPGQPAPGQPRPPVPGQPAASANPGPRPAVPGQPVARPAQPGSPAPRPAQPGTPGATGAPAPRPAQPGQPTARPAQPGQPAKPAAGAGTPPAKPSTPAAAGTPPAKPLAKPAAPAKKPKPKLDLGGPRKIDQVLVDLGFIDDLQREDLLDEARTADSTFERVALDRGLVNEDQILQATAELHGMRIVNLEEAKPTEAAMKLVNEPMANLYKILPLSFEADTLTVVMADPNNTQALDEIRNFLGVRNIVGTIAAPRAVEDAIGTAYSGKSQESINDLIKSLEADTSLGGGRRETSIDISSLMEIADAAPVRKLINMVLLMAIRDHASDIHFEPFEDEYKMRYRCDGVLYEMIPPPRHLAMAIASRIKVMSNLDIAERRMPQDGRIELNLGGNPVDMRVSVLPTMFGESVVIRVLDRTVVNLDLDKIGMEPRLLGNFRGLIRKPNGITLVTGPTGAGKTTTLYSALSELNLITDKLITTEDPVEYEIDGIIQCPINAEIEFTFASALRAILRQDPDKILVGEIRDLETAQIAIQAALTGHMVFSTLHTNDAPSTITRLRDMGVEPYLITATVEGILAQRLVRKICQNCRTEFEPSREAVMELNLKEEDARKLKYFYGEGCSKCNNLGFKGRLGIYELVMMDDELRDLVSKGASTDALRGYCRTRGEGGLREAGLRALNAGLTTLDEVVRETVLEDEG